MVPRKLNRQSVERVVKLHREGKTYVQVSKLTGIGRTNVWRIVTGRLFSELTGIAPGTAAGESKPTHRSNSRPEGDMSKMKMRTCLSRKAVRCHKVFLSHGPGNRICPACKEVLKDSGDW